MKERLLLCHHIWVDVKLACGAGFFCLSVLVVMHNPHVRCVSQGLLLQVGSSAALRTTRHLFFRFIHAACVTELYGHPVLAFNRGSHIIVARNRAYVGP
jgi:hypothetical protein